MKKILFIFGFRFCGSDVTSEVGIWPFQLVLPGLGPTARPVVFKLFHAATHFAAQFNVTTPF